MTDDEINYGTVALIIKRHKMVLEEARYLCEVAGILITQSQLTIAESRRMRAERAATRSWLCDRKINSE